MTLIRLTAMHKNRTMTRTTIGSAIRNQLASFVLATSLALAIAPTTFAQGARGGMASMFTPDFLPRDLPVFVDSLGLEEWQRPILEALLEDYGTNFATAADGVRASMGQLKDVAAGTNPDKIVDLISRPLIAWGDEKKALRNDFLASVKSQLSDVQAEYEIKLDEALAARETELEGAISSLLSAMGPNDTGKLLAINERAMQKRVAVRAVQDASLVAIREALGSEYGPSFEKRALRRAFPQVYGPNPINPLFEAATALPDLTDEQKGKLTALRATFQSEHGVIQARYAAAIRTSEPGEPRRRADALAKKVAGGTTKYSESPEIDTIKSERQELYARFRAAIADILNDAQKETIPGFGKPGAELPAGQKYGDAVHLGTGGGGKPSPNSGQIDEAADPNKRPKSDNPTTMEQTKTGGATKEPKPSKAVD